MSTFVERLREAARLRGRGLDKNKVIVNRGDLIQLLENFDRLDRESRGRHAVAERQYQQLQEANESLTATAIGQASLHVWSCSNCKYRNENAFLAGVPEIISCGLCGKMHRHT